MTPCTWCPAGAVLSLDYWMFADPIDCCRACADRIIADLRVRLQTTFPIMERAPRGRVVERRVRVELLAS